LKGSGQLETKSLTVTGSKMTITADVEAGGSVTVSVVGHGAASKPIMASVTDGEVSLSLSLSLSLTLSDSL
jgi:hypothetical protein